jgi:cobalt/nickel transport system permease protein
MLYAAPTAPPLMHAPDGIFAVWLSILGWIIALVVINLAVRNTRQQLGERQIPLMGVLAAAIFAGQMLNFSIPGGTSGHLLGGALAAIILGPWAGVLIITAVVIVQALLFQDGGLLVMGLNIINMGIVTSLVGYFTYRVGTRIAKGRTGMLVSSFVAGWLSVVVTSIFASVELALSGTSSLQFALPAMVGVHIMIGIGEGLLTASALGFITTVRPDLIEGPSAPGQRSAGWIVAGLILAIALTFLAPLASRNLDGLERVTQVLSSPSDVDVQPVGMGVPSEPQFFGETQAAPYQLLPDYTIPALGSSSLSTILAGIIGVLLVFALTFAIARYSQRGSDSHHHVGP